MIEQAETFKALHDQLDAKLDALMDSVELLTSKVEELEHDYFCEAISDIKYKLITKLKNKL